MYDMDALFGKKDVLDMDAILGGRNDLLRSRSFLRKLKKARRSAGRQTGRQVKSGKELLTWGKRPAGGKTVTGSPMVRAQRIQSLISSIKNPRRLRGSLQNLRRTERASEKRIMEMLRKANR